MKKLPVLIAVMMVLVVYSSAIAQTQEEQDAYDNATAMKQTATTGKVNANNDADDATSEGFAAIDAKDAAIGRGATTEDLETGDDFYSTGVDYFDAALLEHVAGDEDYDDAQDDYNTGVALWNAGGYTAAKAWFDSAKTKYALANAHYSSASEGYQTAWQYFADAKDEYDQQPMTTE